MTQAPWEVQQEEWRQMAQATAAKKTHRLPRHRRRRRRKTDWPTEIRRTLRTTWLGKSSIHANTIIAGLRLDIEAHPSCIVACGGNRE